MYKNSSSDEERTSIPLWKKIILGTLIVLIPTAIYGILAKFGLIQKFLHWASSVGWFGNLFIILFIVFTSFPWAFGAQLTSMACGFIYQWWIGAFTVFLGVALGLSSAFFVLRYTFKDKIVHWIGKGKKVQYIIQSINQNPIKFGLLIRALPLTTGIQTSILSITNIDFITFLWTSLAAEMPQHLIYVYLGTQISDLTSILSGNVPLQPEQLFLMILQIVGAIAIIATVISTSKKAFQKIEDQDQVNNSSQIV